MQRVSSAIKNVIFLGVVQIEDVLVVDHDLANDRTFRFELFERWQGVCFLPDGRRDQTKAGEQRYDSQTRAHITPWRVAHAANAIHLAQTNRNIDSH